MGEPEPEKKESSESDSDDDDEDLVQTARSKWDMDDGDQKLDKLDGLLHKKPSDHHRNMEEFLSLPDDYEFKASGKDGKKHVRWADMEERRLQEREREIGFVVGQTNWDRVVDDNYATKQLNRTKYF